MASKLRLSRTEQLSRIERLSRTGCQGQSGGGVGDGVGNDVMLMPSLPYAYALEAKAEVEGKATRRACVHDSGHYALGLSGPSTRGRVQPG